MGARSSYSQEGLQSYRYHRMLIRTHEPKRPDMQEATGLSPVSSAVFRVKRVERTTRSGALNFFEQIGHRRVDGLTVDVDHLVGVAHGLVGDGVQEGPERGDEFRVRGRLC